MYPTRSISFIFMIVQQCGLTSRHRSYIKYDIASHHSVDLESRYGFIDFQIISILMSKQRFIVQDHVLWDIVGTLQPYA